VQLFLAAPPAKDLLKENEAIINPYYMHQLLEYSIKLANDGSIDSQSLLKDAEVMSTGIRCYPQVFLCLL